MAAHTKHTSPHSKPSPKSHYTKEGVIANETAALGKVSATDKVLGQAEAVLEVPNTLANYVFLPLMAAGGLMKWIGEKTNIRGVEKAGHVIGAPTQFINRPFGYFGGKLGVGNAIPKTIAEAPVGVTVWNASFVGTSGLGMFGCARTFSEHVESLKQMYADMTGKDAKKISTSTVMTGKVPAAVAEARSLLMKSSGLQGLAQTAGLLVSIKQLLGRQISMKAITAQIGLVLGAPMLISLMGDSILPVYKNLADAHKGGEAIPVKTYADFILAVNKELQARGASGKELANRLAEQYADASVAPAVILNEVENGRMLQRIKAIVGNGDVTLAPSQATESGKHSAAALGKQEQPVVGPETAKVVNRREAADPSPVLGA